MEYFLWDNSFQTDLENDYIFLTHKPIFDCGISLEKVCEVLEFSVRFWEDFFFFFQKVTWCCCKGWLENGLFTQKIHRRFISQRIAENNKEKIINYKGNIKNGAMIYI